MYTIYTNVPARVSDEWTRSVKLVEGAYDSKTTDPHISRPSRIFSLKIAWSLFKHRKGSDCFITTGEITGQVLAVLQSLFPLGRKPHIIMSAIWSYPRNQIELAARTTFLRFAYKSVCTTLVNTTHEVEAYSELFKLPKDKFLFLPYCYRLKGYEFTVRNDGYIWSGGNGDRDYKLLIESLNGLNVPVIINATRQSLFEGINIPENINVQGVTPEEFRQYMAGCTFAVIPMEPGKLHPGGQQTFLSLMKMGKPVILTDPIGGRDYINHGENGILVPFGNRMKLREAIKYLVNNPQEVKRMGENAIKSVDRNSEDDYMRSVLDVAYKYIQLYKSKQHI